MSRISTTIKHILLLIALIVGVFSHIAYMCYLRQGFAVGGEWFVYALAVAYAIYEVTENDRN